MNTYSCTWDPGPPVRSGPRGVVDWWTGNGTGTGVKMDPGPQPNYNCLELTRISLGVFSKKVTRFGSWKHKSTYWKFNFLCGVSSSTEIPPESCGSLEENCNNGHTSSWYDCHTHQMNTFLRLSLQNFACGCKKSCSALLFYKRQVVV